ncbi:hypothetical protein [Streptomyces minutiscleroticus]|uniref:Uncharacterized protein n=1 Tax=Streptomyces minutiscleroticus TaxID=68238 RepID=A0A918NW45_9ACTN|nr:hypothetical protein [Streptomyces minutiscleroticus]GGY01324.1 hypothetical protein GCM10010358_64090 [Streptomyces minutiscleroticus]
MHTYDSSRRQPHSSPLPALRPQALHHVRAAEPSASQGGHSATPIYDALYAEYRRSFRALPGDRSGEEDMGFTAFGTSSYGPGSYDAPPSSYYHGGYGGRHASAQHATGHPVPLPEQRHETQHGRSGPGGRGPASGGGWQPVGRLRSTGLIPAPLPPGQRREN